MPKYKVIREYIYSAEEIVEAESKEEAREIENPANGVPVENSGESWIYDIREVDDRMR